MAQNPLPSQAIATAEAMIAEKKKNLESVMAEHLAAKERVANLERTLPDRRRKLHAAKDLAGIRELEAEVAEADADLLRYEGTRHREAWLAQFEAQAQLLKLHPDQIPIERDAWMARYPGKEDKRGLVEMAERELAAAHEKVRRIKHGDLIKRAVKQAGKLCGMLRELDEHLKAACELWPRVWQERILLLQGWPGGASEQTGHPAFADGGLLKAADMVKTIRASLYRHAGTEFVSAAHNALLPPSFPGSKPSHALNMNRKANKSLAEAADHAERYLTAILEGRPWKP